MSLVLFGCFAWDEVWPSGVRDGRKLIQRKRVEVANQEWGALSLSGELCGECLPELIPALLLALVVWSVNRQNAEWCFDGVDGEAKNSAIDACEICDGGREM